MQVELTVTRYDVAWLNFSKLFRVKSNLRVFVIVLVFVTLFGWLDAASDGSEINWTALAITSISVSVVVFAVIFLMSLVFVLVGSTGKSGVIGSHTYTIEDAGFREVSAANDSLNFWSSIGKIEKTRKAITVEINAWLYHVLPRNGFQDDKHYDAFFAALVDHRDKAIAARG